MRSFRVWAPLCVAALATGGAFSILFTGDTVDGASGGFGDYSLAALTGHSAFWLLFFAALAAVFVGSAGRYRFVLVFPAAVVYTLFAAYGLPPLLPRSGFKELFVEWQGWAMNIGFDVYQAANTMYAKPIPYDLSPGLMVILIPIVMIVVAFATSATLYEESPVISVAVLGLTIGVLSTISFEDGAGPFFLVLLAASVVLLLSSSGAERESGEAGAIGWPAMIAGLLVIGLVLVLPKAPFSEETVSTGLIDWTRIGTGGTSQLDVQADVGDYLTYGREAELLRIRSDEPLLWRGGTLDYFDGVRWSSTTEPGRAYGEEVSSDVDTRPVRQEVQVLNARMNRIFGGYKISAQSRSDAQQNSDGSWSVDQPLSEGSRYSVISFVPQPTEAQLQGAGTSYDRGIREKYLQLPDNRPKVIAQTAKTIERNYPNARTPYEKARVIERYLLYDGNFTYNLDVKYGRADKAIEEFLDKDGPREGFCTQFATSMALIAREMNVPSRVVYGATTGDQVDDQEYVVTGSNMHTWVEIYFPGVGWYTFDPTPGFTVPDTMQQNAPRPESITSQQSLIPDASNLRQRQQADQNNPRKDQPKPDEKQQSDKSSSSGDQTPVWPLYALLPALVIATIPLTKRILLARGRPEDLYRDLTGHLRDVLPPGRGKIAESPALTPTERLLLLAGAAGVEEEPFREVARAYSDHLYSAGGTGVRRGLHSAHRRALRAFDRLPLVAASSRSVQSGLAARAGAP